MLLSAGAVAGYGQLPLSFEPNQGQTVAGVDFMAQGDGYLLDLAGSNAVLALQGGAAAGSSASSTPAVVEMSLVGANAGPQAVGQDKLPGITNYLLGNNSSQWQTNIPTFGAVNYQNVYPGVNLVYLGNQQQLEYDFDVAPGSDPGAIRIQFTGADSLSLDAGGNLQIGAGGGAVQMDKPVVYQTIGGAQKDVDGNFVLLGNDQVGFQVGAYDRTQPLVIDPTVVYGTYLGGTGLDYGYGITADSAGDAYVVGTSLSTDFPTGQNVTTVTNPNTGKPTGTTGTGPSFIQQFLAPGVIGREAFVAKFDPNGQKLLYSTFLGGKTVAPGAPSADNEGFGIAINNAGSAYVTGSTDTPDFPVSASAFQPQLPAGVFGAVTAAYMTELTPDGTGVLYSTYLSGQGYSSGAGIAVDANGNAYVTGTASPGFPVKGFTGSTPVKDTPSTWQVVAVNAQGQASITNGTAPPTTSVLGNVEAAFVGQDQPPG